MPITRKEIESITHVETADENGESVLGVDIADDPQWISELIRLALIGFDSEKRPSRFGRGVPVSGARR